MPRRSFSEGGLNLRIIMTLKLVQFPNTDNVLLPGLLYEPEQNSDTVAFYLHGNGGAGGFYSVDFQNTFGKTLTDAGISYITFTNTGGHLLHKFDQVTENGRERVQTGSAYELIKDCIGDIDGVIAYLKSLGYKHFYVIGTSTGANKICVYNYYKKNNILEKYVLVSGGDDSGIYHYSVGDKKFKIAIDQSQKKIAEGKGMDLVPKYLYHGPLSYRSLYDQINPDGDYNTFSFFWEINKMKMMTKKPWRELQSITVPTLVLYGDADEYCYGKVQDCVELFKKAVDGKSNFSFEIIAGGDHNFSGKRKELAERIVNFLRK